MEEFRGVPKPAPTENDEKWKNPTRSALFARYHPPAGRGLPTTILHIRHRPSWDQYSELGRTSESTTFLTICEYYTREVRPNLQFRRRYAHSRALAGVVGKPLPAGGWYLAKSALLFGFFHFSSFAVVQMRTSGPDVGLVHECT